MLTAASNNLREPMPMYHGSIGNSGVNQRHGTNGMGPAAQAVGFGSGGSGRADTEIALQILSTQKVRVETAIPSTNIFS